VSDIVGGVHDFGAELGVASLSVQSPDLDFVDLFNRPSWMAYGACRGQGPDVFFLERGESMDVARAVCNHCPVRRECLAFAVKDVGPKGVWGGESEQGRRRLRAKRPA
jgi:WhiB family redox-sensing transcriptional regulator